MRHIKNTKEVLKTKTAKPPHTHLCSFLSGEYNWGGREGSQAYLFWKKQTFLVKNPCDVE